jgi:hypothetical protein
MFHFLEHVPDNVRARLSALPRTFGHPPPISENATSNNKTRIKQGLNIAKDYCALPGQIGGNR